MVCLQREGKGSSDFEVLSVLATVTAYGSSPEQPLGVAHEHEVFDDTHSGIGYRFDVPLPNLAIALSDGG